MYILGISAFFHDSAAVLIHDNKIVAAAQEERFTRVKNDASFPEHAIRFCLAQAGCSVNDLTAVAFYDKPFLKFERLLETYHWFAPKGFFAFLKAMPQWLNEKLFVKRILRKRLKDLGAKHPAKIPLLFPEHHLSHAASAFYPSPFDKAAILTIDGVGEWTTTSVGWGDGAGITRLRELHFPHSLGLLYSAFTYYLGFAVNSGEYKLMGLAPYGNAKTPRVQLFEQQIREHLIDIQPDGSFALNQDYFCYATGSTMTHDKSCQQLFGIARRLPGEALRQEHCDLALAIQHITEEVIDKLAQHAQSITGAEYLCLAGGVALNGVALGRLHQAGLFKAIFIQPAAGDAGGALGAALAAFHIFHQKSRKPQATDQMQGCYLGPSYSAEEIGQAIRRPGLSIEWIDDEDLLVDTVARLLADAKVVGWFQGRMEFGPRALGSRSILADPRDPAMQSNINRAIKFREGFRPFAPIVAEEEVGHYFEHAGPSPHMMVVKPIQRRWQLALPAHFSEWSIEEKMAFPKSAFPAVTHVDYSCRLQSVSPVLNSRLWKLLQAFKRHTGHPLLVNTSFNVQNEPIVNTPQEAVDCFLATGLQYLVAGNYLVTKSPI